MQQNRRRRPCKQRGDAGRGSDDENEAARSNAEGEKQEAVGDGRGPCEKVGRW